MMKWVQQWIGAPYAKLWQSFGSRSFTPAEAQKILEMKQSKVQNVLSRLFKAGYLVRLARGFLTVLSPGYIVASIAGDFHLDDLQNRPHTPLIKSILSCLINHFGHRLVSVSVFGSVGRGDYSDTSDIDFFIAVNDWHHNIVERVKELVRVARPVTKHLSRFWTTTGIYSPPQWYPLDANEVPIQRPLYLDMIADAIVLYDVGNTLTTTLEKLRILLKERGIVKVILPDSGYLWVAKSGEQLADVFSL